MTKPFGLNVSFKTAAQLVKMPGSFTCAGGGVSDVCNGLLAKQNSVVFKPIVVLAIKYMWAVKSKTPISAPLLGYEGANAETLIVERSLAVAVAAAPPILSLVMVQRIGTASARSSFPP